MQSQSYYITGVVLGDKFKQGRSIIDICIDLVTTITCIVQNGRQTCGEDALIFIVMCEYALTEQAIDRETKNKILKLFCDAMSTLEKCILIPGSIPYYEDLDERPDKKQNKIDKSSHNYIEIYPRWKNDNKFKIEFTQRNNLNVYSANKRYLQNATYIITHNQKIKHRKFLPWNERQTVCPPTIDMNTLFFYPGLGETLETIQVGNQQIDLSVGICRDVFNRNDFHYVNGHLANKYPFINVVVSNFLEGNPTSNFIQGAINILMDEKKGLVIYIDESHYKFNPSIKVKASTVTYDVPHLNLLFFYPKSKRTYLRQTSALHEAVKQNAIYTVSHLLTDGANPNFQDENGSTPLHLAVHKGNIDCVRILLEAGANPTLSETNGFTSLHIAQKNAYDDIFILLLKYTSTDQQKFNF